MELKTKNVVIVCVTIVVCFAMVCGVIVYESIQNHNKGAWTGTIEVDVRKVER